MMMNAKTVGARTRFQLFEAIVGLGSENVIAAQAHNQLGTPGVSRNFLIGAQNFELRLVFLNYVQHIFPVVASWLAAACSVLRITSPVAL